jgi:hypothetical protein
MLQPYTRALLHLAAVFQQKLMELEVVNTIISRSRLNCIKECIVSMLVKYMGNQPSAPSFTRHLSLEVTKPRTVVYLYSSLTSISETATRAYSF